MGCQREVAEKILGKKADYLLALTRATKARCAKMSRFSPPSRKPTASRIQRSATIKTAAWDDEFLASLVSA
jgi:hypothetical protein